MLTTSNIRSFVIPRIILFLYLVAVLTSCFFEEPANTSKAKQGFAILAPTIQSLTEYYRVTNKYPDSLDSLVPNYLNSIPQEFDNIPIHYQKRDKSYILKFSYQKPGINHCIYTPKTDWNCHGYF